MSIQVQHRRGTTANHAAFTGATGEITVDTTKNVAVVHDGVTAGGHPLVKAETLTDHAAVRANGTAGAVQDSGVIIDDSNNVSGLLSLSQSTASANSAGITLICTDAGAGVGPVLYLLRSSATPAASDSLGLLRFSGKDSAGNDEIYVQIATSILDPTNGSEDGRIALQARIAGTTTQILTAGPGVAVGTATDQGANTFNAGTIYEGGTSLAAKYQALDATLTTRIFKNLTADEAGANVNTAQPWFPTAGSVTLATDKAYRFTGFLHLTRSGGTTSHTTSILFGGTWDGGMRAHAVTNSGDLGINDNANRTIVATSTAHLVKDASTSAAEQISIFIEGTVRVVTGGTFTPQFQYSAAPGGAPTVKTNSFFELFEIGSASVESVGTWS